MQAILYYFQEFFQGISKPFLVACTLLAAVLVVVNFRWGIEPKWLANLQPRALRFVGFYILYLIAFGLPWLFYLLWVKPAAYSHWLLAFVLLAPAVFALKVSAGGWGDWIRHTVSGKGGRYLAIIADWPLRLVITVGLLFVLHRLFAGGWPLPGVNAHSGRFSTDLGLTTEHFTPVPYLLLLAAMVPLVAFAASQPAFLHTYPKVKILAFLAPEGPRRWQQFLYEIAYGLDFLGIELFFRGFLVVLLCRWVGPAAILPMAVFYCSVHFGKPLLECISSYFGGIILGVIACYSQSILGGILVHLGLAWMMEAAAFISSYFYTN